MYGGRGPGNAYLGSLAVIGVTMMTLWLFSIAILLGAELNKVIRDRRATASGAASDVEPRSREVPPATRRRSKDTELKNAITLRL